MTLIPGLLTLLAGYLLGSIPSGYLAGRWLMGIDIRRESSGSTGATNVLRVVGKGPALAVFAVDVGKGAMAVLLARAVLEPLGVPLSRSCPPAPVPLARRRMPARGGIAARGSPPPVPPHQSR